ncbi:hypothetical protein WL94_26870 [Burkholderia cepacia]|nr:hypothetical protein WL26_23250 [Burkholderia cepacia]KWF81785.1 hypothetical protein WL94_26870 [Burkholderia cepacia]
MAVCSVVVRHGIRRPEAPMRTRRAPVSQYSRAPGRPGTGGWMARQPAARVLPATCKAHETFRVGGHANFRGESA